MGFSFFLWLTILSTVAIVVMAVVVLRERFSQMPIIPFDESLDGEDTTGFWLTRPSSIDEPAVNNTRPSAVDLDVTQSATT